MHKFFKKMYEFYNDIAINGTLRVGMEKGGEVSGQVRLSYARSG